MHLIEPAKPEDAQAVATVLNASIHDLCEADHKGDRAVIETWTSNKTRDNALRWILDPEISVLVSRVRGEVAAVGAVRGDMILLNYVDPRHRHGGHSKALLAQMEALIHAAGHAVARLESTRTAHRFYESQGWHVTGPDVPGLGIMCTPMAKALD